MKQVLRRWLAGLLSVIMLFGLLPSSVYATPSAGFTSAESGSGRDSDPYIIASADQLAALSAFVNSGESCSGLYFRLEGDIKLEGSADHQWTPIGKDYDNQFMGSFDGDGHTISGLYIDSTSNYQGLFGAIGSDGIVKNLAVSGSVTGNNYVGGIAGYSVGIIENCHNDASITGNSIVGGIAGDVYAGTIQKCYNRGTISGSANVGGIAGSLNGSIQNCYNLGEINSSETAGGIAGFILAAQFTNCYNTGNITSDISYMAGSIAGGDSVFTNCYFLQGTAAYSIGGGGSSNEVHEKTAEEFFTLASVLNGSGSSETWKDEPFLGHPVLVENPELVNISGDGTADEPYLIPDLETLELVRTYVDSGQSKGKYFKLTSSIDMSEKYNAETSTSWIPIGSRDNSFQGTFDGGNNKINNLYIDNPKSALGLFGAIGESGKVKNLTVDGYIFGGAEWKIGGLAGECQGSIENCHSSVDITNGSAVGGIAGLVTESAIVTGCTNSGSIISTGNVAGGIAGSMGNNSTIQNCYNTGEVNTFEKSGGIVGEMSSTSTVTDCYNTGAITGFNYVGGIVGTRSNGDVSCCYNTGDIADYANVGGIVGLSEDGTTTNCYYLDSVCSDNGQGTQKSEAAFTSGEVAWLLQNGQDPQVWGQGLKGSSDEYPVLTTDTNKKVYKVTFQAGDEEYDVKYANPGGVKELPTNPSVVGMVFDHWSTENLATEEDVFTENTPVTGDITVYAVGKHTFGGDDADIPVGVVYGYDTPQTVDLDKHMEYQNGSPVTDKFQYEIENDGGATGAEINNNTLTIPIGLNAGEYTIKVKATEKDPFALMSVSSFDTEPVTLTIKVTVSPATISFTLNQTEATYTGTSLKDTIINAVKQTADENPKIEPSGYSVSFKQGDVVIEDPTDVGTYEVWVTITDPNFQFAVGSTEQKVRDFTINKGTATVTPDAVSPITYGEPVTIKVTITPNPFTNATQPDPITDKVEFAFKKGGSVSSTVSDEGTATITIKPDEVKNYFSIGSNEVTIHYNGNKNLNPSTNASVAVTVNQKQLEFAFDANNKTYDGSKEVKGTLTMKTPRVGNDDVTATYTATAESADVGNAIGVTVDVTLSGHDAAYYEAVNPTGVTVDISKASVSGVTLPAAKTNLVYSGALQDLIEAGSCEEGTMQYALGTETSATDSYSAVIPTATDAGTYYVWYKVVGDGNHSDTDPEKIQVTIAQKVVTLTWKLDGGDNFAATYTGSAHTVTATADGLVAADLPEGVKIELSGNTATDPGNYSAKAVLTGSRASNYKLLNSTRPYSIGMHASSVTVSVSENPTYGSDITLTATVTASGIDGSLITGALTFQANGENLGAGTSDGNGSWSLTIPGTDRTAQKALFGSNGLDVSIAAAYAGNGNIAASSGTATASIAKRTLTYTVTAAGRTYDGTTVIQVTLKPADLLGGDNVSLTATGNVEKADANSYSTVDLNNIALSGDDARFYSAAAEAQDHALSTPVVIKPIEVTLQWKLDEEDALTIPYDGNAHTVSAEVSNKVSSDDVAVTVKVASNTGTSSATDGNPITEAGTYTAMAIGLTGTSADNYKLPVPNPTKTITITSKALEAITPPEPAADLIYNGAAQALLTGSASDIPAGTTILYYRSANGDSAAPTGNEDGWGNMESITATDAGTYTIWYKVDGGTNYKNLGPTKIGTVSIDKAAVTETVAISENPTYGSDITLTATVASKTVDAANISGTVQFKVGEEPLGEPVTVQEGTATLKIGAADAVLQKLLFGESGTSAITAAYSGTGNIAPDIGTTTVSMEKKALTYKVSAQDKTYDGTTTVSVTLTPTNLVGEDAVTLAATGNVAKPDIGDYDTVDLTGIVLSGDDAKYYAVDGSKSGVTLAPPVKILERHKEDGTGMVSMADYTCGDTSVEPKAVSETNVGAAVSITYKPKDAPDTAYSPTKPTTAGEYTVRAVFAATEQYNEVTATADFTITHQFPTSLEENEDFICACEADLRLEAESIEAIPPALQETYSNVEELSRVLVNATGVSGADYTVYDVKLEIKEGSEAWHDAPEDSIPASGLTITLPYPAGTDSSYTFTVIHMFAYGEKAGSTEKPAVTNTADGIRFTVSGLSPVCIAWTSPDDTPRYYVVIADNLRGGTVSADKTYVLAGDTVTLTVTPENGYRLSSLTVTDAAGSPLKLTDNGDGTYTFVQPSGDVTVTAAFTLKQAPTPPAPQRYPIYIPSQGIYGWGTVVADRSTAAYGEHVYLTVTPDAGCYLDYIVVRDQYGNRIDLTYLGNNVYVFTQPIGEVTVYAAFAWYSSAPAPTPTPTPTPAPTTTPAPATYSVMVPEKTDSGSVTVEPKNAAEGTSVKLTPKAEKDYHLDGITVVDKDGKPVELKANSDGTYTFTMPAGTVSVQATFVKCASLSFPDLDPTAWYHTHTDYVIEHKIMNGTDQGLFAPDGTVTRAQMVTVLWNMQGKPVVNYYMTYSDVDEEAWYSEAVRWATSEGVAAGYGNGTFGPNDPITREQMAVLLYQYKKKYRGGGFTGTWLFQLPFTDLSEISEWAYEGVAWCYMSQVMAGKGDDIFDPAGITTRAELAAVLTNYLKQLGE